MRTLAELFALHHCEVFQPRNDRDRVAGIGEAVWEKGVALFVIRCFEPGGNNTDGQCILSGLVADINALAKMMIVACA